MGGDADIDKSLIDVVEGFAKTELNVTCQERSNHEDPVEGVPVGTAVLFTISVPFRLTSIAARIVATPPTESPTLIVSGIEGGVCRVLERSWKYFSSPVRHEYQHQLNIGSKRLRGIGGGLSEIVCRYLHHVGEAGFRSLVSR